MARRKLPDLRRSPARLNPKAKFILYCEGKNTEPIYFRALESHCQNTLISIETNAPAGVPYTIAEKAVARWRELRTKHKGRHSFEEQDQVWAIFDRDEHPKYAEAIQLCEQSGVRVARSNPCFELWLILHEEDFDKSLNRHGLQRKFEQCHPSYNPRKGKLPDCTNLVLRVEDAEKRAEAQFKKRENEGNPIRPPYTTVWELTREIRLLGTRKSEK